jgi:hypothetical protein
MLQLGKVSGDIFSAMGIKCLKQGYRSPPIRTMMFPNENGDNGPRMHNKFLILFGVNVGVWTGSFNFTENALQSKENAIYTEDPQIVGEYLKEFGRILCSSSEILDDWEPERYFTLNPNKAMISDAMDGSIELRYYGGECCWRCGRDNHDLATCYSKRDRDGRPLRPRYSP